MNYLTGKDPVAVAVAGCGIYCIKSPCGRVYIGKSLDVRSRIRQHLSSLKSGTHHNSRLQSAWVQFCGRGFSVEFVEDVDPCNLGKREHHWVQQMDALNPEKGFNLAGIIADGTNGFPCELVSVGEWQIYRRLSDGYCNGTALCSQFGKRFDNWLRLQDDTEINALVDTGPHGSWIHIDLVLLIASWLSYPFYFAYMSTLRSTARQKGLDLDDGIVAYINKLYGRG